MRGEKLDTKYMDILILILRGKNTSTKISRSLKLPRKTVANQLSILYQKGYIDKNIMFNTRPYELTSKGKEATAIFSSTLKGRSKTFNTHLQAHKVTWSIDITKKPYELIDLLEKNAFVPSQHRTWQKYRKELEDCKIVFNPNKVYIYLTAFYLDSPMEYYDIAIGKVRKIKEILERKFPGLVLGTPDLEMAAESQHIARKHGPLAMKFFEESIKAGKPIVYHGSHLNVDFSEGPPEEETVDKKTSPADMLSLGSFFNDWIKMPIMVKDLHAAKAQADELVEAKAEIAEDIQCIHNQHQMYDTTIKRIESEQINVSQDIHSLQTETREDIDNVRKFIVDTSKATLEVQGRIEGNLIKLNDSQEIFATAMHEHVALIKTLQVLAQKNKEGLENGMQDMGGLVRSAFERMDDLFARREDQHKEEVQHLYGEQKKLMELLIERSTPWYAKLWNKIQNMRGENNGKTKDQL